MAAIEAFQVALAERPRCSVTLYNAAVALDRAGEGEGAIKMMSIALDAVQQQEQEGKQAAGNSGNSFLGGVSEGDIRLARARMLRGMSRPVEALVDYESICGDGEGGNGDLLNRSCTPEGVGMEYAAVCCEAGQDAAKVITVLEMYRSAEKGCSAAPVLVMLAERSISAGDLDSGVEFARRAVASHRGCRELACLGLALSHKGHPEEALGSFEEASGLLDGEDTAIRRGVAHNRSVLLLALGRREEADRVYRGLMAAGPGAPEEGETPPWQ